MLRAIYLSSVGGSGAFSVEEPTQVTTPTELRFGSAVVFALILPLVVPDLIDPAALVTCAPTTEMQFADDSLVST